MLQKITLLALYILTIILCSSESFAEDSHYPTNEVKRPLTLPEELWELGLGLSYIQSSKYDSDSQPYNYFNFMGLVRYGISDHLEYFPFLVFRYRFAHSPQWEVVIGGGINGFLYSSSIGQPRFFSYAEVKAKQRLTENFGIIYQIENHLFYTTADEEYEEQMAQLRSGAFPFSGLSIQD
ncbi:hypothetical protein WDW89_01160 [Deltaproteobacteria bacterium TL4]